MRLALGMAEVSPRSLISIQDDAPTCERDQAEKIRYWPDSLSNSECQESERLPYVSAHLLAVGLLRGQAVMHF